jgi:hypothetical protein
VYSGDTQFRVSAMAELLILMEFFCDFHQAINTNDRSDDIEMGYGLDGLGSIPGRGKIFLSSV